MAGLYAIMLPFLAHGHMTPYLALSRMLATKGVTVIYVSTPCNVRQIRSRAEEWDVDIHFEELAMPPTALPPGCENTSQIPTEMIPFIFEASDKLDDPFHGLMEKLSGSQYYESKGLPAPDRLILIHDIFMGWSEAVAARFRVPSYMFLGTTACTWLCLKALYWQEEPLEEIARLIERILPLPDFLPNVFTRQMEFNRQAKGILINCFPELEPKFYRRLLTADKEEEEDVDKRIWAIGPVVASPTAVEMANMKSESSNSRLLKWLDRQSPRSVVYIAFGSETRISGAQMTELALGLEASEQPFVWVIRPPLECSPTTQWTSQFLPPDYELRLKGRCFIETGWAPQSLILSHESTGAYLTHCGCNSMYEGIMWGIPMITWPFHSDQHPNALILNEEAKVGASLVMYERDKLVTKEEVERVVRRLMLENEGNEIRRSMKKLSEAAKRAVAYDRGSAWNALQSFIEYAKHNS